MSDLTKLAEETIQRYGTDDIAPICTCLRHELLTLARGVIVLLAETRELRRFLDLEIEHGRHYDEEVAALNSRLAKAEGLLREAAGAVGDGVLANSVVGSAMGKMEKYLARRGWRGYYEGMKAQPNQLFASLSHHVPPVPRPGSCAWLCLFRAAGPGPLGRYAAEGPGALSSRRDAADAAAP